MAIEWNEQYRIGVPEIDQHHQTIIEQLAKLHEQMKLGKGKEIIGETLTFMASYVKMHFAEEEKLMEKYDCPIAALNKQQHAEYIEKLNVFKDEFEKNHTNPVLVLNVQQDLVTWITNHILKIDLKLKDCMK